MATTAVPTSTITWKVVNLERETADGFVFTAHYTVDAKNSIYSAGAYGSVGFERPDRLIAFSDLTEKVVIDWIKAALGEEKVNDVEAALTTSLDEQAAPTKAAGLPW
jgi:hypothetical protein